MIFEDIQAIFSKKRGIKGGWGLFFDYVKIKATSKWKQARHDKSSGNIRFRRMNISVPEFATFSSQFSDIFVRERDYFKSDSPAPKILDIGANVGIGDLYFKMVYPKAIITAYEVDPKTFGLLQKNMLQNGIEGVACLNVAIGDKGTVGVYEAASSLSTSTIQSLMQGSTKTAEVVSRRLSEVLTEEIDLLKIDCEGAEYEIIRNSKDALRRAKRIHLEFHPIVGESVPRALAAIEEAGFDVYIVETSLNHRLADEEKKASGRLEVDAVRSSR